MASIRTAGLTKDFGDLRAVNEIDLDLPEGGVAAKANADAARQDQPYAPRDVVEGMAQDQSIRDIRFT